METRTRHSQLVDAAVEWYYTGVNMESCPSEQARKLRRFALGMILGVCVLWSGTAPGRERLRGREILEVGQEAPDLSLVRLAEDGSAGERVTLSSFAGKRPVVLVFSSYT